VRWDVEEDLSRIIGDAPAHMVAQNAKKVVDALRSFVLAKMPNTTATKDSV
jgi:ubiquinone biosynthesis protein UbiJ